MRLNPAQILTAAFSFGVSALLFAGGGRREKPGEPPPVIKEIPRWRPDEGIGFADWLLGTYGAGASVARDDVQQSILWALQDSPHPELRPVRVADDLEIYATARPLEVDGIAVPVTWLTQQRYSLDAGLLPLTAKEMDALFRATSVEDYAKPMFRNPNIPNVKTILDHAKRYRELYAKAPVTIGAWKAWTAHPLGFVNHGFLVRGRDTKVVNGRREYRGIAVNLTGVPDVYAVQLEGSDHLRQRWHADYSQALFGKSPEGVRPSTGAVVDMAEHSQGPDYAEASYHRLTPEWWARWRRGEG